MGASLWDQVWLPLLIGVAIQIAVAALCFLSVRLWNCLMHQIKTRTAVGVSAHDQPLHDIDAAAHANGVPDLEMGNGYDPAEVGERDHDRPRPVGDADDANALPDLEMGTVNGGEGGESKALPDLDVGMANGGEGEVPQRAAAAVGQTGS